MSTATALRSTSEPRHACRPKSASTEIFRKSRASQGRSAAYQFVASRDFAFAYENVRQDRQFLQTDPVGYRDDINLYAYVGNDPLNRRDPTGTSCTITTAESGEQTATCRIDRVTYRDAQGNLRTRDATAADHQRFRRFESAYTAAVNRLLATPNASVSVTVPGPPGSTVTEANRSFTATAGEVGRSLAARQVTAIPDSPGGMSAPAMGQIYVRREGLAGRSGYGVRDRGFVENVGIGLAHEGLHNPGPDRRMGISHMMGMEPWSDLHQVPYNQAAEQLLGY